MSKNVPAFSFNELETPLLAVGATILSHSKVLLLKNVHFLLSHLDPRKAQICYLDTDSCYLLLNEKCLENNVLPLRLDSFHQNKDQFIDSSTALGKNFL